MKNTPKNIAIEKLFPFDGHPFKVQDNEEMNALIESIQEQGILSPLIVRPKENTEDEYEIVSGHRRFRAAVKAGIKEVPALIVPLDRDAAAIAVVDSNLHREHILPSEKAFAYKLKMEALSRQGKRTDLTSGQIVPKPDDNRTTTQIGIDMGDSYKTVQRYIRLTNLIPPILDMVDEKRIAFTPAVELSYLGSKEQAAVMQSIEKEDTSPSIAQAKKIRKFHQDGKLNVAVIDSIMMEQKPETIKITLGEDKLKKYFPKSYTKAKMEEIILKLLDKWHRQRENEKER